MNHADVVIYCDKCDTSHKFPMVSIGFRRREVVLGLDYYLEKEGWDIDEDDRILCPHCK